MHNFIKGSGIIHFDSAAPYLFPKILKNESIISESDKRDSENFFQRIFLNLDTERLREEEKLYLQKKIEELYQEGKNRETDAYNSGIEKGYNDGKADGYKTGFAEGVKEIEPVLRNMKNALKDLDKRRKELYLKAEKEVVSLSLAIAKKIILQEPYVNPDMIVNVVRNAFESFKINPPVRIRVNPSDLAYIQKQKKLILVNDDITFVEDQSISAGGSVIESISGDVDARIEEQILMIEEAFAPEVAKIDMELTRLQ